MNPTRIFPSADRFDYAASLCQAAPFTIAAPFSAIMISAHWNFRFSPAGRGNSHPTAENRPFIAE
jgi:hypothetical protein